MKKNNIKNILFFSLLGLITILFLYLLKPFFYPIFWAAVIASIFHPIYKRLERKLRRPSLSAIIVLCAVLLLIILPSVVVGILVVNESFSLYSSLSEDDSQIRHFMERLPDLIMENPYVKKLKISEEMLITKLSESTRNIADFIFTTLKGVTQGTALTVIMFFIMIYALFFFIRDGDKMLRKIAHLLPLGEKREEMLFEKFTSTARATLKGVLIIAFLQGSLGGLLFFFLHIEGALIWWILMIFTAVIPSVGCALIWFPTAIVMLFTGHVSDGVIILLFGSIVITSVDNFLRPILVGRDTQMHPLLIFFSTVGGLALFGFSGIVIGPIITALMLSLWEMYERYFENHLTGD